MEQFRNRITELADRAYQRDLVMFSDFLDLNQQDTLQHIRWRDYGVHAELWGGYPTAERVLAAFVPDGCDLRQEDYPIECLLIRPVSPKYADKLTHRDFLGSLLALGIERSLIGDLIIRGNEASVLCVRRMASFLQTELVRVRHTDVCVTIAPPGEEDISPAVERKTGSVASVRLDALIALAFSLPRSKAGRLLRQEVVYVNAKQVTSNGHALREGDLISVRGFGKCRFAGIQGITKKGRLMVCVERFI